MMNEKERLTRALLKEKTDRPPCICPGGMMNMVTRDLMQKTGVYWPDAHVSPELMAQLAKAAYQLGCFENYGLPFCMTVEAEAMGAEVNLGDMTSEPRVVGYAINSVSEWASLPPLDFNAGRTKVVLDAIGFLNAQQDTVPIIASLTGPISVATSLLEATVFYKELRKKPDLAHEYLAYISDQILQFGIKQLEAGADVIAISDPSSTGEILGPQLFEEFAVPYINLIIEGLRKYQKDCKVIIHICGKVHKIFAPLDKMNGDAISIDALVNMREAVEHLPGHAVMGNVSTYALEFGTPEKVSELTKQSIESGAEIISPACGLGNHTPLLNMQAILSTVRNEQTK